MSDATPLRPLSSRVGGFAARRPWAAVAFGVAVLVAAGALALPGLDRLVGVGSPDENAESSRVAALTERATGAAAQPAFFVLLETSAADAPQLDERMERVQDVLDGDRAVASIDGPLSGTPGSVAFLGQDGRSAFFSVTLETDAADEATIESVERLRGKLEDVDGVRIGGAAPVGEEITDIIREDLHLAEFVVIPILLLLALLFFRSVVAALVPVAIAGVAVAGTALALVGATYVTDISNFALNLTSALAMGLGIDYGLLLVSRFREELGNGLSTEAAVARTMATAGRAVTFSAATVGASMAALLIFPQTYISSIGIAGVLVAVISGLAALIVVPAMLQLLGPNIDALSPKWLQRRSDRDEALERGRWYRTTLFVSKHAVIVAVITGAIMLAIGIPTHRAEFTTADETILPKDSPSRIALERAAERFPQVAASTLTMVVPTRDISSQSAAERIQSIADDAERIVGERGEVQPPQPLGKTAWRISATLEERALSDTSLDTVEDLRRELPDDVLIDGVGATLIDTRDSVFGHAPAALAIVVLTTMFFILALTGSIVLAVKTVVMNALTLAATFGVMVWIFQDGLFESVLRYSSQGALEVGQPMIVAALVFGLSTDYGVFLLSRVKEAHDGGADTTTALAIGTQRTGRVITTAALLFCVAMCVSAASRLVTVKQVGFGVAFAVLLDATIVRGILVPALMQLLGRWNWWAPGPLKRIADRSVEH